MNETIIGLSKPNIDPDSGAPIDFWIIAQYTVRPQNNTSQVTMQGYVSKSAFSTGKRPLAFLSIELQDAPATGEDAIQWFYAQVPDAEGAGQLAGAVPMPG